MSTDTVDVLQLPLKEVMISISAPPPKNTQLPEFDRDTEALELRHRVEAAGIGINPDRMNLGFPASGEQIASMRYGTVDRLITDLQSLGFRLTKAWWWDVSKPDQPRRKYKTVFLFTLEGDEIQLSSVDAAWFERRCRHPHDNVFVWANPRPNGSGPELTVRSDSIELAGLKPDEAPRVFTRMPEVGIYTHDNE
ncbi:MAG: hypothetical protein A2898_05825 [Candidatus Kerfeldbacteria bacterium RIFCSPLOWO2_01_FULL_48_11]|uniref:Uncharacterized protein n=1 Tax=Candidatus Kerfeldbacteria bacterium RIFCSPLOWO2_01_FULL_48_11 TaxID=1798543 RepID=A0A1G2B5Z0_9BACT|nr:MAG: hypothetical protein UY34_C0007G0015 [Parcubacteria group bacterium GW2011_GWA2_48_9]KKW15194.1 MAG: hypothetical protein UY52_C0020G0014 [Parcubacteria group bacterium GW2011_GWC2_49_9]OGY83670.1 MAG: hypothetical protein A2898_05825 [Candidatus Kerfeldbacteria bacterium RIFCSPLOWO2_01_FULL_48_11]HCM68481.1 hypothetical protein [Candidatus Kerfeldbacteria bacterium]